MGFVHLNVHSHYSLLDALGTPKDIIKKAKEQGFSAVGLTDNAYLYGAVEFYKAAKEAEIKAVIGCEFYLAESHFDKSPDSEKKTYRLTILAKNNQGYQNLLQLSTTASLEGYLHVPRIDFPLLQKHHEGLIVLSGSKWGELSQLLINDQDELAEELAVTYQKLFGENYYIEIQRHPQIASYAKIENKLIFLAKKLGIGLVATYGPHYLKPEDATTHDILICIGRQTNINDANRYRYDGDFSFKSPQEMEEIFKDLPEALENTVKIADQCDVNLKFGQYLIPIFKTPNGESSKEYLRFLCEKGLRELFPLERQEQAQKQLNYELEVVDKMGFNDYFLITWDFINYAKNNGIMVGPGRGSAAGAIIAYTLKITELDPIEHGLVFERFLNPDRISMPDIDIDFADSRRHEVLEYTINKYGKDCVSQVITYGTMSAKAAVRDVGRGMGYSYSEVDQIAKAVPPPILGKHTPLAISTVKDPALSDVYQNNPRAKALLDNAIKLEGTVRHAGTHACAVIIADRPLVNFTPLQRATDGSDGIVTQYSMKYLEDIGLLKMDFLGLKNLTLIEKAINLIEERTGEKVDITKIPLNDEKTFEVLQRGDTTGVFQLESSGMRRYIRELKPTKFDDIVAMISLYRPGPLEWIPTYIEGKHKPETIKYQDPSFEGILKETNGIAIYQEQILQIARIFSGFTLGEADILRRAVGKKDPKALAEQKDKFVQGAIKSGHTEKHATEIFEKVVEPFAGYGFNKSHAAC
ncbi:DNA polymerase III subunit alpha, partial [Candidatus Peregrinibacteria bacterium]|nr:DNA polymerase III subunit alpha [Candidatus Peregrinibacteria bacterium]